MSNRIPPLGNRLTGEQERKCSRLIDGELGTPSEVLCGKRATTHIFWTPDLDNGWSCDEHATEFQSWRTHPLGDNCGMPGARYFDADNRCGYEGDDLPEIEPVRAVAEPVLACATPNPDGGTEG